MLVHYIEFMYPGIIVTETSSQKIESRAKIPAIPERAFGYRFFDREEVEQDRELLKGETKNYSPNYYFGEELTLEEVKGNMECNGHNKVVHTQYEQSFPLRDGDLVVERPKPKEDS